MTKTKGICSHCEHRGWLERRKLSLVEKVLIGILTAYAFGAIMPDFGRLLRWDNPRKYPQNAWYPLGTLGFEADNDGNVTKVEPGGPAWSKGIRKDDVIDLSSKEKTERRAINQWVFVALGSKHKLHIKARFLGPQETPPHVDVKASWKPIEVKKDGVDRIGWVLPEHCVELTPKPEGMSRTAWLGLSVAQVGACLFILLSLWLVCCRPSRQTWGLFLYSIWFNSGQYFVWYANLPDAALVVFDYLQALFEALGLTGILLFALHFPEESGDESRRLAWRLLVIPFVILLVVRWWTFRNFTEGLLTANVYYVWYALTLVVFIVMGSLLWYTYMTQVPKRPQIRWVALGAVTGLQCWLIADTYETIGFPSWNWLEEYVDFLYGMSFLLPFAIFIAIRRFRVIDVWFAIRRGIVVMVVTVALGLLVDLLFENILEFFEISLEPSVKNLIQVAVFGVMLKLVWQFFENIYLDPWLEMVLSRRWHKVKNQLTEKAEELAHAEEIQLNAVNWAILDYPTKRLRLKCGALYRKTDAGAFELERSFGLHIDCQKCGKTVRSELMSLPANSPIFEIAKYGSQGRPQEYSQIDSSAPNGSPGFTTPAVAVPIVHGHESRLVVTRVVLLGPHVMDQNLDPDEIDAVHELARAAATAYQVLDIKTKHREELERVRAELASKKD